MINQNDLDESVPPGEGGRYISLPGVSSKYAPRLTSFTNVLSQEEYAAQKCGYYYDIQTSILPGMPAENLSRTAMAQLQTRDGSSVANWIHHAIEQSLASKTEEEVQEIRLESRLYTGFCASTGEMCWYGQRKPYKIEFPLASEDSPTLILKHEKRDGSIIEGVVKLLSLKMYSSAGP